MSVRSVLGVFAQPKGTDPLRLQAEQRSITQSLKLSQFRDSVTFEILSAATVTDLRRALLQKQYDVVHFSGHGDFDTPLIRWIVGRAAELGVGAIGRLNIYGGARLCVPKLGLRCIHADAGTPG